jgi:hypothetical protein
MREMLGITALIYAQGNGEKVAFITDGRFSGATRGMCIGYPCPEARANGPIARVRDGDIIEIDASPVAGTIHVALTDDELDARGVVGGAAPPRGGLLEKYALSSARPTRALSPTVARSNGQWTRFPTCRTIRAADTRAPAFTRTLRGVGPPQWLVGDKSELGESMPDFRPSFEMKDAA